MSRQGWQRNMVIGIGRGSISIVEVHLPKGGHFCIRPRSSNFMSFTSRTKILKNGASITSEMNFTESLLLQKGHFLSSKRGRSFKKYFSRS